MSSINLLPPELTVGSQSLKLSKLLKKINLFLGFIIVLSFIILTGATLLFITQTRSVKSTQNEVETKITALKETEQKLVLIRDRLEKISKVLSGSTSNLETLQDLSTQSLVIVKEADIKDKESRIEIETGSLKDYTEYIEGLVADDSYSTIKLSSFFYGQTSGYNSELILIKQDAK